MGMKINTELPLPAYLKAKYPLPEELVKLKAERDEEIRSIFEGKSDKFVVIVGPCSADREDSVCEYVDRLAKVNEKVSDRLMIIPRIYTNKPRTTGEGYKGMLHQPEPDKAPDLFSGIIAIRKMHIRAIAESGLTAADEMLYPSNYQYLVDLLSYVAVGARSVENQEHRLVSSGISVPVGMKNPTAGSTTVMLNSIYAAQAHQSFIFRNWEVECDGNPLAHAVMRGYIGLDGRTYPNYHYEHLERLAERYTEHAGYANPAAVIDCNHDNSGKRPLEQYRICKEVLDSCRRNESISKLVKGFMIESYLEDGNQPVDGGVFGKSITDPCLGWEKTDYLIHEIAERV